MCVNDVRLKLSEATEEESHVKVEDEAFHDQLDLREEFWEYLSCRIEKRIRLLEDVP